ncbi:AAA family ATPase [Pirellulales bacterium]|nr:AAA family ATPase [Pirellulales bacterium]
MYQVHWGLVREPFAASFTQEHYYAGGAQGEVLARLRYLTVGRRRLGWIIGDSGSGKSTLLDRFARQQRGEFCGVALLNGAGLSPEELFWQLAAELSLGPRPTDDLPRHFRRIADFAATAHVHGDRVLLLLDDADQAGPDLLGHVLRLLNLSPGSKWLSIVLASRPCDKFSVHAGLFEAADVQIPLEPWTEEEVSSYVCQATKGAGSDRAVFTDEALFALHTWSKGLPRRVNQIAQRALIISAKEGAGVVEPHLVEQAALAATIS